LKETIRQPRKQLEQAEKAHEKNKYKRDRVQGRNPLPRRIVHTNSIGTQTELHAPLASIEIETQTEVLAIEETYFQTEGVFPTDFSTPLETIEMETQTEAPATIEKKFKLRKCFTPLNMIPLLKGLKKN